MYGTYLTLVEILKPNAENFGFSTYVKINLLWFAPDNKLTQDRSFFPQYGKTLCKLQGTAELVNVNICDRFTIIQKI